MSVEKRMGQIKRLHLNQAEAAQSTLERTAGWIDRFGGRLAGSDACRQSAEAIQAALQQACGNALSETFITRPGAFTEFYKIDIGLYFVGLILLFFQQPFLAAFILIFMFSAAGLQFGWYVEFYDRFFPRVTCNNVTAILEPRGTARRQLILSGHHDSAPELNFLKRNQKFYVLKIVLPDFFRATAMTFAVIWSAWQLVTGRAPYFVPEVLAFLVLGIPSVMTKFFLFGKEAVPGAGDNLVAAAMLVELAQRFADPAEGGKSILENTRLILVSFDAEEAGLRGSRAWADAHDAEVGSLPTFALNIDSIYTARDLQFLTSDLNGHVQLDSGLVELCLKIAAESGYPAQRAVMRFGGGATDAVELIRAGARATTMIAMPAGVIRDGLVYHTMNDTVAAIEPAAVDACLRVAEALAYQIDQMDSM
jgi:aminopeptidase YwaD